MYVCMYVCMYVYICIYMYVCNRPPLKDLLFSCVGEPDAANRQQGLSFKQRNWRECKRLDMHDFDAITITPKKETRLAGVKAVSEQKQTRALLFSLIWSDLLCGAF